MPKAPTSRPAKRPAAPARPGPNSRGAQRRALGDGDRHARAGTNNGNAKVTEATVRAWRAEAARLARARLRATGGLNVRTGAALTSPFRGTGLFARLAREAKPPVSVAAVSMAVHGETWGHVPGALTRYVAPKISKAPAASRPRKRRGRRTAG
ncbi:hypothetical protein tb265_11660 [Gemmatimonadetes bacterium T265]|nr:hypothetical protein tb265_11660 [Gemmatimonadetes bacterium T265]